jgi:hypothetical protein
MINQVEESATKDGERTASYELYSHKTKHFKKLSRRQKLILSSPFSLDPATNKMLKVKIAGVMPYVPQTQLPA